MLINKNLDDGSDNLFDPRLLLASQANKDIMHYGEAMAADDKDEFIAAMVKEIKDLFATNVWELILLADLPTGAILIPLI